MTKSLPWLIFAQLLVTLALLAFAYVTRDNDTTSSVIIGAVVANWLNQGAKLGQQVSESRSSNDSAG